MVRPALVAIVVLVTSCVQPALVMVSSLSTERFPPGDREMVWGRALEQVQRDARRIEWCSYESGVLRASGSEVVACAGGVASRHGGAGQCVADATVQVTLFHGAAMMQVNRAVVGSTSGLRPLLGPGDADGYAQMDAETLATITGR